MTRRTATLVTSIVVLVITLGLVTVFPVPFVSFSPGPVENTLGEAKSKPTVEITGHETFPTTGELDLTTVSVTSPDRDLTLPQAMRNWLDPHHDLFPRDIIYPPEQSADEVQEQNTAEMTGSQDSAVAAALQEAKVPFKPKVSTVSKGSPADGKLKPGDVVLEVDGQAATQVPQVGELVRKNKVGEEVSFLISRGGKQQTVVVKTAATPGDADRPMVGISIGVDSPVKVERQPRPGHRRPQRRYCVRAGHLRQADPRPVAERQARRRYRHHRRARPGRRDRRHPAEDRRRAGIQARPSSWCRGRTARRRCTRASRTSSW